MTIIGLVDCLDLGGSGLFTGLGLSKQRPQPSAALLDVRDLGYLSLDEGSVIGR